MIAELEWLKGEVKKLDMEVVFSHGDLWWGNVIYNKEKGTEYSHYTYVSTVMYYML